jgi:hypothetical protein
VVKSSPAEFDIFPRVLHQRMTTALAKSLHSMYRERYEDGWGAQRPFFHVNELIKDGRVQCTGGLRGQNPLRRDIECKCTVQSTNLKCSRSESDRNWKICVNSSGGSIKMLVPRMLLFLLPVLEVCLLASFVSGRPEVTFLPRWLFSWKPVDRVPEAVFLPRSSAHVLSAASLPIFAASAWVAILRWRYFEQRN